jgi:hypothetical protein
VYVSPQFFAAYFPVTSLGLSLVPDAYIAVVMTIADPFSRQRGRPIDAGPQISDINIPTGNKYLVASHTRVLDTKTY